MCISIPLLMLLIFALTYLPQKIMSIDPANDSMITFFNGSTGLETQIINQVDIHHIINNLNELTFQKGKPSFLFMGYHKIQRVFSLF